MTWEFYRISSPWSPQACLKKKNYEQCLPKKMLDALHNMETYVKDIEEAPTQM